MEIVKKRAVLFLRMIKFSHSVFALPFALTGAMLASRVDLEKSSAFLGLKDEVGGSAGDDGNESGT